VSQEVFLDVETEWDRTLTVVGFRSSATGLVQLVGSEITARRLQRELPKSGRLYTFNGHAFDLPCILAGTGVDLRSMFESHDLRWVCHRAGLRGGQKAVEARLGYVRNLVGLDGRDAIRLWRRSCCGDHGARRKLLAYNAEDLEGLAFIRRYLSRRVMQPA
jgi:uncharacterized protein YprB with RNaseH-like and TPR domain